MTWESVKRSGNGYRGLWTGPVQIRKSLGWIRAQAQSTQHSLLWDSRRVESYKVGEKISVTITARDHNKNLKRYGGDFFQAKLFNSKLKVCYFLIYFYIEIKTFTELHLSVNLVS